MFDNRVSQADSARGFTELRTKYRWVVSLALLTFGGLFVFAYSGVTELYHNKPLLKYEDVPAPTFNKEAESKFYDFEFGKLHVLTHEDEQTDVHVFALHGSNVTTQSAEHWTQNFGLFERMGNFHVLDLPGFGESEIDRTMQSIPNAVSAYGLHRAMVNSGVLDNPSSKIVFLARAWGAEVIMMFFRKFPEIAQRDVTLILVAPSPDVRRVNKSDRKILQTLKGYVIWGEKDAVIPSSYSRVVKKLMPRLEVDIMPGLATHQPEKELPGIFAEKVLKWWKAHA